MLGEFRLLRKLGAGGMAEVYLAEQTNLRRQVAVKVLRPEFVTNELYVKRFLQEAAAAGGLSHPNIVQVYMVGEQDGINYIAQEYVQGRTLKSYLKRKGPIDIKIALHILRQVASALQAASENGIVHRDIKPENILLTSRGEAKVADFGLAQLTNQGDRISLTQSGVTMGTPLYMSPEQVNGLPLDSRSDIYSYGIMAWHILAGRPPFVGENALSVAVKHLNEKPPPLSDFRPDVPPVIRDFIKRLIRKKKEDRPADFAVVLSEIKQIIRQCVGKDESSYTISLPTPHRLIFKRPFRQQIGWMIGTSLLVFVSAAAIGWRFRVPELRSIPSTDVQRVPVKASPQEQLLYADANPTDEAAWIAVRDYQNVPEKFKARAQSALGIIYLKTNRITQAEEIFKDLTIDPHLPANGFAGQALIAYLKGDTAEARRLTDKVDGIKATLFPELENAYKDLHQRLSQVKP